MSFLDLSPEQQNAIRLKQKAKQLKNQEKKIKRKAAINTNISKQTLPTSLTSPFPCSITQDEYFSAAPKGLFRHPQIKATESGCNLLLQQDFIAPFNYFMFTGSHEEVWEPSFNAFLAWNGFFTITHGSRGRPDGEEVPLPELQPYYGVLLWYNFEHSKYVKKELARLNKMVKIASNNANEQKQQHKQYRLMNCHNPQRTWNLLNRYHKVKHGSNWLTKKYFQMMQHADENPTINFTMHCVELYDDDHDDPLSGEIGFSIGKVYTSLSGWTEDRTPEGTGTIQLVLLGRWLQQCKYSFWSLGHCYSPEMDYKRQLGHRIFPRTDFLNLLKQHRGDFHSDYSGKGPNTTEKFIPLQKGASISYLELIGSQTNKFELYPEPIGWSKNESDEKLKKVVQKNASNNATSSMHTKMKKIKPNAPCPCGSGKKYKKCCK
jgi:hypothetical protein